MRGLSGSVKNSWLLIGIFFVVILDVYKGFEGLKVLVDVGGGIGVTLNVITSKYPQIRGINFDLPHVVSDAPSYPGIVLLLSLTWELMNIGFFILLNT